MWKISLNFHGTQLSPHWALSCLYISVNSTICLQEFQHIFWVQTCINKVWVFWIRISHFFEITFQICQIWSFLFFCERKSMPAPGYSKWKILCILHSNMCYSHNCWLQTFNLNGLEQTLSIQLKCRYPLCCSPSPIMCFPGCWLHFQPTFLLLITFFKWVNEMFISQSNWATWFFISNKWWLENGVSLMQFIKITYMPITTFLRAGAKRKSS